MCWFIIKLECHTIGLQYQCLVLALPIVSKEPFPAWFHLPSSFLKLSCSSSCVFGGTSAAHFRTLISNHRKFLVFARCNFLVCNVKCRLQGDFVSPQRAPVCLSPPLFTAGVALTCSWALQQALHSTPLPCSLSFIS